MDVSRLSRERKHQEQETPNPGRTGADALVLVLPHRAVVMRSSWETGNLCVLYFRGCRLPMSFDLTVFPLSTDYGAGVDVTCSLQTTCRISIPMSSTQLTPQDLLS